MDFDAFNAVMDLFNHAHELGEAIWSRIELWTGISFGTIVLAYIAPNRLTPLTTVLILLLYIGFSVSVVSNIESDRRRSREYIQDALAIAEAHSIETVAVREIRHRMEAGPSVLDQAAFLYIPGLLLGTIGYLCWTSYTHHMRREDDA